MKQVARSITFDAHFKHLLESHLHETAATPTDSVAYNNNNNKPAISDAP